MGGTHLLKQQPLVLQQLTEGEGMPWEGTQVVPMELGMATQVVPMELGMVIQEPMVLQQDIPRVETPTQHMQAVLVVGSGRWASNRQDSMGLWEVGQREERHQVVEPGPLVPGKNIMMIKDALITTTL